MKKLKYLLLLALISGFGRAKAHTLPQCKAQLVVNNQNVLIHFKSPVEILELAYKSTINLASQSSVDNLKNYVLSHLSISDTLKSEWKVSIGHIFIQETKDAAIGNFPEINIDIYLTPTNSISLTNFIMNCDLVIHQIPTQSIIFSVEQDWQNGIIQDNSKQIGVISIDIPTGKIYPFPVKLKEGTWWKGFKNMISLGISHISEGTDHILFILTLLLPAMLLVDNKRWGHFAGEKKSFFNLLKITTAFTIGHSLTLMLGTIKWLTFPTTPIEVLIAITILISAFHAFRPLYPKKEIFVAGGFGLIHGLAFANTLTNLQLSTQQMVLSILGFNIGIELMQLFVILITIPWLILLSRTSFYTFFRIGGAILAGIAACAWMLERIQNEGNFITILVGKLANQAIWLLVGLVVMAVLGYFSENKNNFGSS